MTTDLPEQHVSGQLDEVTRSVTAVTGETGVTIRLEIS